MKIPADTYLDYRLPEWLEHEKVGRVRYDELTRMVIVDDAVLEIVSVLRRWS